MAQAYTDDVYDGARAAATDLQNMENNFAALKSCFSGALAPANVVAGMQWYDTTQLVTKRRDSANAAWHGLMHGDAAQKLWVYRDAAMEGWAVDATVTDQVLAIKGGATYATGGAGAGAWVISGLGHIHAVGTIAAGGHTHTLSTASGALGTDPLYPVLTSTDTGSTTPVMSGSTASGGASDGAWRPAASVGTLQYLDL